MNEKRIGEFLEWTMDDKEVFLKKKSIRSFLGEKKQKLFEITKCKITRKSRATEEAMQEVQGNFFDFVRGMAKKGKP